MADKNNLLLTVVLVAGALMLFNGGIISGNAVGSAARSCAKEGSSYCIYGNDVYECMNGQLVHKQTCDSNEQCVTIQMGGQTTSPQASVCVLRHDPLFG